MIDLVVMMGYAIVDKLVEYIVDERSWQEVHVLREHLHDCNKQAHDGVGNVYDWVEERQRCVMQQYCSVEME